MDSSTVMVLKLDAVQVLALACFGAAMGVWLKRKLPILDRLNVPASIVGGLVYAVIALGLRDRFLNIEMDLVLRDILMITFFTTVGMSASLRLVRVGGVQVLLFFALASAGAALQNVLGVGSALLLGMDPIVGLIAGSVSMTGGPATALAFGGTFENLGVAGASTLGVAAAMFGIVVGGLLGGPVGAHLIRKHGLAGPAQNGAPLTMGTETLVYEGDPLQAPTTPMAEERESEHSALFQTLILIAVAMGIGSVIGTWLTRLGLILPAYIGGMVAAAVIRNLDDKFRWFRISQHLVDAVGNISLYVFIVMALLTLRLWELAHLALPVLLILVVEVVLVGLVGMVLAYRLMGKDYDAAVMAGGFCGFMLGTTANAMACMDVLVRKFGPAPRAYIVVPIVGAFLIDFTNALIITTATNLLR